MVERFVSQMAGVSTSASGAQRAAFRNRVDVIYRSDPAGVITGELGAGQLDLEREWRIASELTSLPLKFTVTSPYMIAKLVHDEWYGDFKLVIEKFAEVLAEQLSRVQASVVQIDEPNLPGSPQDAVIAADAINTALGGVQGERAVHLCFGNYGGQRIQHGQYNHLLTFFNNLACDHLVLETTRRPIEEIEALRDVKQELAFAFGVIDVKDLQVESPTMVAKRIDSLAAIVGMDRIRYVNPDCGLSHLPRDVADQKLAVLRAGRDLVVGSRQMSAPDPHVVQS
jgi:5-methyltetrahydropteroyltriglutamate--homocysteine methyltransferase